MTRICSMPTEVTEHALTFCSPRDVASFAQSCHLTYSLIYRSPDQYLWRQLFLAVPFDDLRLSSVPAPGIDWRAELQDRIRAESFLRFKDVPPSVEGYTMEDAMNVVLQTIHHAPPAGPTSSGNIDWAQRVISSCPLFTELISSIPGASQSQSRARLLAYIGMGDFKPMEQSHTHVNWMRTESRCFVYNLRHYKPSTNYGVFMSKPVKTGIRRRFEVNWVHIRHCINVIIMNIWDLVLGPVLPPRGLEATRAYSAPGEGNRAAADWAGVEGVWRRYVCFMDYRDLFSFNFSTETTICDPAFFDNENFHEATRLIELELHLLGSDDPGPVLHPIPDTADKKYPRLNFAGKSRGLGDHRAVIKGHVDRYMDGTIQWTFLDKVSVYDHQTNWLFSGIQLGNVCSEIGVVGTWTGADHEPDDPSGPSWIWKVAGKNDAHVL